MGSAPLSLIEYPEGKATRAFKIDAHDIVSISDKPGVERSASLWVSIACRLGPLL